MPYFDYRVVYVGAGLRAMFRFPKPRRSIMTAISYRWNGWQNHAQEAITCTDEVRKLPEARLVGFTKPRKPNCRQKSSNFES